jgi:microcystin-dependent protein
MEGYLAEIRIFAGNFAPRAWAFCQGQLLAISQYQALFSLIGTIYGGDGRTTFALPDLRGRVPVGASRGPGLRDWRQGEVYGSETHSLPPAHSHSALASGETATSDDPRGRVAAVPTVAGRPVLAYADGGTETMEGTTSSGQAGAVSNFQPSLGIQYIICVQGIYPSRS